MVTEPTLSCTTFASFRIGAMASEASEHSSPITTCGLNWSSMRFTALVACRGLHAESSYCTWSLTPFTPPLSSSSASSMPSLSITPKYDPGPEIGIATPMRTTRSCAAAAMVARATTLASASLLARFMTPLLWVAANVLQECVSICGFAHELPRRHRHRRHLHRLRHRRSRGPTPHHQGALHAARL